MVDAVPFLGPEQKVEYLYERSYFPADTIMDDHVARLSTVNFHYFLGYARNYRLLASQRTAGIASSTPDDVFRMIDRDHAVAQLLYKGLRQVEWRLRALIVDEYCSRFDACSYLQAEQYLRRKPGSQVDMVRSVLQSVLRHGEPYVDDHITDLAGASRRDRPKKYEEARHEELVGYVKDLPLWAVVDSFTLGTLSHFITECDGTSDPDRVAWRSVAHALEIKHPMFHTNIESLTVLRNQVSHHARLWMRPTTASPKKPRIFDKELRDADPKSMMVAFANVALFHGPDQRHEVLDEVFTLVKQDPLYYHGVTKVRRRPKA
ncbi:Abi family protein [Arsenicicoccus piscis]|nr:Abi family protein [Arsenicicoccus piscis]MCH8626680.1 Abi family protein [Arsenicicoccus piscis]